MKRKLAAKYCGLSLRTFDKLRKMNAIREIRIPTGTPLFNTEMLDEDMGKFEVPKNNVDQIVEDIVKGLISGQ